MNLLDTISSSKTKTELFKFKGNSNADEFHAYIHITDNSLTFNQQVEYMADAVSKLKDCFPENTRCIIARFHVSDAANQTETIKQTFAVITDCPISIIQQPPLDGTKMAIWINAISNSEIISCKQDSILYKHNGYQHLWTTANADGSMNTYEQTTDLFNRYSEIAITKEMTLEANCRRTWLYVNDIDNHYSDVVVGRNDVFDKENLTDSTHYIASTGITGYTGKKGVNVKMDTYSINGLQNEQTQYLYATSHLNRTSEYGVRFERGVAILYGDRTHAFISGTASIDDKGNILYPLDINGQIWRMWENVEALLSEVGMNMEQDIAMMTIYLRDIADYEIVKSRFDTRFPNHPKAIVLAPVCRPGWLIEMECICVKAANTNQKDF